MYFNLLFLFFNIIYVLEANDHDSLEVVHNPPIKGKSFSHAPVVMKRVGDTLNMTCLILSDHNDIVPKYNIVWHVPKMSQNKEHKVIRTPGNNQLNLVVHNLQETDTGDYICNATRDHEEQPLNSTIRVNVKQKKTSCVEHTMFQCPQTGICIYKRYLCDGRSDCKSGADEAESLCGEIPCSNKLTCPDGRCIPKTWCCDPVLQPNCSDHSPACCHHYSTRHFLDTEAIYSSDSQRFSDMGFLQTTIYAVVGSAMAFVFVVTILIVAICRIHLRRHAPIRTTNNNVSRTAYLHQLYDLEVCLNRPAAITYNINNGVQFVGRPVSPPPYSEVVSAPPREGPPPPYASCENVNASEEQQPLRSEENA